MYSKQILYGDEKGKKQTRNQFYMMKNVFNLRENVLNRRKNQRNASTDAKNKEGNKSA